MKSFSLLASLTLCALFLWGLWHDNIYAQLPFAVIVCCWNAKRVWQERVTGPSSKDL